MLNKLSEAQFFWLCVLVFIVTFCVTYPRVVRWLNKRWPRN